MVAAIVVDQSRVLIAQRKDDSELEAGKWEFPGGKVEFLEDPEATLVREIREELDLSVRVERIFDVASHVYEAAKGPVHIVLLCYLCKLKESGNSSFRLLEVSDAKWVKAEELADYDFAAADVETVKRVAEFLS